MSIRELKAYQLLSGQPFKSPAVTPTWTRGASLKRLKNDCEIEQTYIINALLALGTVSTSFKETGIASLFQRLALNPIQVKNQSCYFHSYLGLSKAQLSNMSRISSLITASLILISLTLKKTHSVSFLQKVTKLSDVFMKCLWQPLAKIPKSFDFPLPRCSEWSTTGSWNWSYIIICKLDDSALDWWLQNNNLNYLLNGMFKDLGSTKQCNLCFVFLSFFFFVAFLVM